MTRKEAIKTLRELWRETNDNWYEEAYEMAIEALSAEAEWIPCSEKLPDNKTYVLTTIQAIDAVEVVRCKDCKHRDEKCGMGEHRWCKILKMSTAPNDYCSYGEERKDYREFNF